MYKAVTRRVWGVKTPRESPKKESRKKHIWFSFQISLNRYRKNILAIRHVVLALNAAKCICDRISAPKPHWGNLQRSTRPLAVFKRVTSWSRERQRTGERKREKQEKRKGRTDRKERGDNIPTTAKKFLVTTLVVYRAVVLLVSLLLLK